MTVRLLVPAVATLLLAACASQPRPLQGSYREATPHALMQSDGSGTPVRWGGRIVQVEPRADETCFEMISTRLTATGRPYWASDDTNGRFIACRTGFYDPAVFEVNREVTFTGRISGYETRRIGEYDYRFPRVAADVVYLWPKRDAVNVITRPEPWPWWGWW
ncbi:Slp family lipoprotein [Luteimonas saliphila]|uniref:Slp family lipoprotein n=1 Tax=Luteimonas saliphila TaxID=2804919 RepID=UPI00192DE404|nr:Slp family lipoprotein [Luteimonas saliphila]